MRLGRQLLAHDEGWEVLGMTVEGQLAGSVPQLIRPFAESTATILVLLSRLGGLI